MSFQIYFRDMRHGGERTSVCVADSSEEFRNTTVEELKRKLIPEDQLEDTILRCRFKTLQENRTLGFYGIKHEDHIIAERRRIPVTVKPQRDSSPVHESAAKNIELDNYDLKPLEDDHTLGSGIKHEDESSCGIYCILRPSGAFEEGDDDDDDDKDKVIPRSQSMDNLLMMHQPQLEHMNNDLSCLPSGESFLDPFCPDERQGQERTSVCVADSSEEFRNTTVEELKRKLIPEDQLENTVLINYNNKTLKKNHTLGFYGIKHEDYIFAVRRGSTYRETTVQLSSPLQMSSVIHSIEDDDDEELHRTQSMDIVILLFYLIYGLLQLLNYM